MNMKKLFAATSLAFAAFGASATTLDALTGNLNVKLVGQTTESHLQAGTNESTWGVGAITQILGTGGAGWNAGLSDGTYLYYMLYGISDQNVVRNSPNSFDIYNVGATNTGPTGPADGLIHLDIYRTTTRILELDSNMNALTAGRTGYSSYNLLTGLGPTYLSVVFAQGKQLTNISAGIGQTETNPGANETLATLVQTATSNVLPAKGDGTFFADVVGGTAMSQWNTNGQYGHDMDGEFTLKINGATRGSGTCSNADITNNVCFAGLINDPILVNKIPEPGSLALLGLALAGLAGVRRRKNK